MKFFVPKFTLHKYFSFESNYMRKTVIIQLLTFLIFSCQYKDAELKYNANLLTTNSYIDSYGMLKLKFYQGELERETISVSEDDCICRYYNDTLNIDCVAGFGFTGAKIRVLAINDAINISAIKSSCTYDNGYESAHSSAIIDKRDFRLNDTVRIFIESRLFYSDSDERYLDTLDIKGSLSCKIEDKDFSFKKRDQEIRFQDFSKLANGRPDTVTALDLSDLALKALPDQVLKFTNLKHLDLGFNSLTTEQINKLEPLLSIENLNIEHNGLKSFPASIIKLINLKCLNIFANDIIELPKQFISLSQLQEFQMESNDFDKFPAVIKKMSNLEKLYMSGNKIPNYKYEITKLKNIRDYN
jgi:hypothetical protein